MRPSNPRRRLPGRRQHRPTIDGLEPRELLSSASPDAALYARAHHLAPSGPSPSRRMG